MFMRQQPPPPPMPAPSVLLLRAVGDLQRDYEDMPLDDLDAISAEMGIATVELPGLIAAGIRAGFLEEDREGAIMLSAKGQHWYICHFAPYRVLRHF